MNIGIIGYGVMGRYHYNKYCDMPGVSKLFVADTDPAKLQHLAQFTISYTNPYDLLGKVDAVSICTPPATHYELTKTFLEQNTHVLLEKPMTGSYTKWQELRKTAKKRDLILQAGLTELYNPAVVAWMSYVPDAKTLYFTRRVPWTERAQSVDILSDLMIHDLAIMTEIWKDPYDHLEIFDHAEDYCRVQFTWANGRAAELVVQRSHICISERRMWSWDGEKLATVDALKKQLVVKRAERTEASVVSYDVVDALTLEITSFMSSIKSGIGSKWSEILHFQYSGELALKYIWDIKEKI